MAPADAQNGPNMTREIIESRGVRIPFYPEIMTPPIERPLRKGRYEGGECLAVEIVVGKDDRVLELGTGIGLVSTKAAMADGVDRVLTFEANPSLIPVIREIHELNGVRDRIEVVNGLVTRGEAPETLAFYRRRDFWASSLSPSAGAYIDQVDVATHDFDAVLADLKPTIVVCDIEGAELDLFDGADLSSARYVIMEIHPKVYGAEGVRRIFDNMSAKGFGYSPKISRGGTVITFERVGAPSIAAISTFTAEPAPVQVPAPVAEARAAKAGQGPRVLIPTCMKNEGPYILEWIAYHRAIGVTDFLIFTNDCTDGSDLLLDRLDQLGIVQHLPNPALSVASPHFQPIALSYIPHFPVFQEADYVISMDVDEFLNIRVGDGTIPALLNAIGDADAISMMESIFACDDAEVFEDKLTVEQFSRCMTHHPGLRRARRGVKSLVRRASGLTIKNHRPFATDQVSYADVTWLDGAGKPVPEEFMTEAENGMDCRGRYDLAFLNHYPLRSMEGFLLKHDRGDVVSANRRVTQRYWRTRNRPDVEDVTLHAWLGHIREGIAALRADPEIARLHDASVAWHKTRITELRQMPEYQEFLSALKAMSGRTADSAEEGTEAPSG